MAGGGQRHSLRRYHDIVCYGNGFTCHGWPTMRAHVFFNLYILVVFVIAIIKTVTNACIYVSVRFICLSIFHHGGCVWGLGMAVNLLINSFLFFFYSACLPAYFPFFFLFVLFVGGGAVLL